MAALAALLAAPWRDTAPRSAACALPWGDAGALASVGAPYSRPVVPGGTVVVPGSLAPARDIAPATSYTSVVALEVIDLRDDSVLPVEDVQIELADGSDLWSLSARGPSALAAALLAGEQPATVEVRIGSDRWRFVVEAIDQPRAWASTTVSITGRSPAAGAGSPYQVQQTWSIDAPTTAAQLSALVNTLTGVEVRWLAPDWTIPASEWSATTDPLGVVRELAAAIGAVVEAHRTDPVLIVRSRYPTAPAEWAGLPPDLQIAWAAVESAQTERVDQPPYDGVVIAGSASGGVTQARLAGTSGARQAPMVSDPLLTDPAGQRERAAALLHSYGGRSRETRTIQYHGGVIDRGALVRCVEPEAVWCGLVRAVSVSAALGKVRQRLTMERPTSFVTGSVAPDPIVRPPGDPLWSSVVLLVTGRLTAWDVSQYGRVPIEVGTAPPVVQPDGGRFGPGLVFSGAGSVRYATDEHLVLGTADFSVEAWVRTSSNAGGPYLVSCRGGGRQGWYLCLPSPGGIGWGRSGSVNDFVTHGGVAYDGQWHYLQMIRVEGVRTLYVDGARIGSSVVDTTDYTVPTDFVAVGADRDAANRLTGNLAVRITAAVRQPELPTSAWPESP